jgi:hypothetical protein
MQFSGSSAYCPRSQSALGLCSHTRTPSQSTAPGHVVCGLDIVLVLMFMRASTSWCVHMTSCRPPHAYPSVWAVIITCGAGSSVKYCQYMCDGFESRINASYPSAAARLTGHAVPRGPWYLPNRPGDVLHDSYQEDLEGRCSWNI